MSVKPNVVFSASLTSDACTNNMGVTQSGLIFNDLPASIQSFQSHN